MVKRIKKDNLKEKIDDLFYCDSNIKALNEAFNQYENGKIVEKLLSELEDIANA